MTEAAYTGEDFINETVELIAEQFRMDEYRTHDLKEHLSDPRFFEYWFNGHDGGSYKVLLTGQKVFYIRDQYQRVNQVEPIKELNEKIVQLTEKF